MPVIEKIKQYQNELVAIRHDLHAHPEIGFEEVRTSGIVANLLEGWGITVHRGLGGTGVVGELKGKHDGNRRIGLRADMDALPIQEETGLPYASTVPGKMHACGHDGHTTILLGRRALSRRDARFRGHGGVRVPAGGGGARRRAGDAEGRPVPEISLRRDLWPAQRAEQEAGARVGVSGCGDGRRRFLRFPHQRRGSHGARPNEARDPIIVATAITQALQTIVSRNNHPRTPLVVSVTQIHAGSAYNVIPAEATISGTVRAFSDSARELVRKRMKEIAAGMAATYGVEVEFDARDIFTVLENHPEQTEAYADVAREIVGEENLSTAVEPVMGSEDFADMLRATPGAYCWVGHACDKPVHNPEYTFDDAIIPVGASLMARIVEKRLSPKR